AQPKRPGFDGRQRPGLRCAQKLPPARVPVGRNRLAPRRRPPRGTLRSRNASRALEPRLWHRARRSRRPRPPDVNTAAFKAILWDNDGVLVDTEHLYFEATRQVLASAGVGLTEQQYIDHFLVEGRGAWHLLEERGVGASEIARLRDERNDLYGRLLRKGPRAIPGVAETLQALRGQYVMGV